MEYKTAKIIDLHHVMCPNCLTIIHINKHCLIMVGRGYPLPFHCKNCGGHSVIKETRDGNED